MIGRKILGGISSLVIVQVASSPNPSVILLPITGAPTFFTQIQALAV
jgi:hypothetical protein